MLGSPARTLYGLASPNQHYQGCHKTFLSTFRLLLRIPIPDRCRPRCFRFLHFLALCPQEVFGGRGAGFELPGSMELGG